MIRLPALAGEGIVSPSPGGIDRASAAITQSIVYDRLVTIECEAASGRYLYNGWVGMMDGSPYLVTRQSFLLGAERILFRTRPGTELHPVGVELSLTQDIARLPLEGDITGINVTDDFAVEARVYIPEVSHRPEKVEDLAGKIIGIGPDMIEISAEFEPASSGSPVLTEQLEAVGITSHVIKPNLNVTTRGTQFGYQERRFCSRVANCEWTPVNWRRYNAAYGSFFREHAEFSAQLYRLVSQLYNDPVSRIRPDQALCPELMNWKQKFNHLVGMRSHHPNMLSNAEFVEEYSECVNALLKLSRARERRIEAFLEKERPSGYLKKGFEMQLQLIATAVQGINCVDPR